MGPTGTPVGGGKVVGRLVPIEFPDRAPDVLRGGVNADVLVPG